MTAVLKRTPIRRSAWGEKRKQHEQHEATQALVLEGTPDRLGLFGLHKVDWLHCVTPRTDKGSLRSGFPDYMILGEDWLAFLEIKHGKLPGVKAIGKLSANQREFHARLERAHQDVLTAWLPEDLAKINAWLTAKTGRVVNVDGLIEQEVRG